MARVGEFIEGKYEVIRLIGEGGMSRVYLVMDQRLNKFWAVKEIGRTAKDANNAVVVQSLIAEANLMKRLDHPALPRIVDIIQTEETIYVVMDYVEGESLNKVMRRVGHAMPQEDVIDWGIQLCDALGYLHSRNPPIIYRDMKPGNIMLNDKGTVKLIDFGIAREYKEDRTSDTMILGTRGYAAPEQFSRTTQTDARTDIYSLGVTLHHLVTGRGPSEDTVLRPIREINPQLSEGLEYIITKATQADPARRYQSCAEMAYDLEHYDQLTAAYRRGQKKKLRTFTGLWIGAIVCAVLGAACIGSSFYLKNSTYESYLAKAQAASKEDSDTTESAAETACLQAIKTSRSEIEPYSYLVNSVYGYNTTFSVEEAGRWDNIFGEYSGSIDDNKDYASLCYDVGILYYLYYAEDSGENLESAGITQAVEWFERAIESYESRTEEGRECSLSEDEYSAAKIYLTIGEFYSVYSRASFEGDSVTSLYTGYWEALEEAIELVENSGLYDKSSGSGIKNIAKLRLYSIIHTVLESGTYLSGLQKAGVEQESVEEMYEKIFTATVELVSEVEDIPGASNVCMVILDIVDSSNDDSSEDDIEITETDTWANIQTDLEGAMESTETWANIQTVYGSVGSRLSALAGEDEASEATDAEDTAEEDDA